MAKNKLPNMLLKTIFLLSPFCFSCNNTAESSVLVNTAHTKSEQNAAKTIAEIPLPTGFERKQYPTQSFGHWLQYLPLSKDKTVYLFDGTVKQNQQAQYAVINMSVGNKNLQQCADAIMRLRAEYFFTTKQFSNILFVDNEGGKYQFTEPFNRTHFDSYLQKVFGMCGTASLAKQLKQQQNNRVEIGNVLIKPGFPGHAVIVVDVASNKDGETIYLLAQSYMPAQSIHILQNPTNSALSPWYIVQKEQQIITPEYLFTSNQFKSWE